MVPDLERYSSILAEAIKLAESSHELQHWLKRQIADEFGRKAVEQSALLQRKAIAKFGEGLWWCTTRSLMQATHHRVAEVKSEWIRAEQVYDLCCGIGGDSLALKRQCQSLTLVDRDPMMLAMATANLRRLGSTHRSLELTVSDIEAVSIPSEACIHVDPDRRVGNQRASNPVNYSPSWETVLAMIKSSRGGLVKVAPAARFSNDFPLQRMWISFAREVREQTLVFGDSLGMVNESLQVPIDPHVVSAVIISGESVSAFWGIPENSCAAAEGPAEWMVDPDAAIRAAGLTACFAKVHELSAIGGPAGFLTGDRCGPVAFSKSERVIWKGACDDRKLRRALRDLNVFPKRVKTRGVPQDANQIERRYRDCGDRPSRCGSEKGKSATSRRSPSPVNRSVLTRLIRGRLADPIGDKHDGTRVDHYRCRCLRRRNHRCHRCCGQETSSGVTGDRR